MMTPELVTAAMKMIGVLALIVGGLLAFNAYSKRFFKNGFGAAGHKAVRVIENTPLGIKKSIALVKVPGAVLVLGVTHDRISLLNRIDEPTFEASVETSSTGRGPSFKEHLRRLSGGLQRKGVDADLAGGCE
jgi:flagellar biogenesis protein FliO